MRCAFAYANNHGRPSMHHGFRPRPTFTHPTRMRCGLCFSSVPSVYRRPLDGGGGGGSRRGTLDRRGGGSRRGTFARPWLVPYLCVWGGCTNTHGGLGIPVQWVPSAQLNYASVVSPSMGQRKGHTKYYVCFVQRVSTLPAYIRVVVQETISISRHVCTSKNVFNFYTAVKLPRLPKAVVGTNKPRGL